MKTAQVHRFDDCVALFLSNGVTVYMTPKDARTIAKNLNACARDVKQAKFVDGTFKKFYLELTDTGYNGTDYREVRK